jgi:hypothetical protein
MFAIVHAVERRYELDSMKRSLAMLSPGQNALSREEAMKLLGCRSRQRSTAIGRASAARVPD